MPIKPRRHQMSRHWAAKAAGFRIIGASGIETPMDCCEVRWNVSRNTRGVLGNDRNQLKPKLLVPGGGVEPPRICGPADFESAASASSAIPAGKISD
jgi:hypothetical protein